MGLCTPCAGTRPAKQDPTRSKAAYPPPRLVLDEESRVIVSEVVWGKKILVFSGPGTEIIGFWWSGDRKYWFLVVRG